MTTPQEAKRQAYQAAYQRARPHMSDADAQSEAALVASGAESEAQARVAAQAQAAAPPRDVLADRGYDEMNRRMAAASAATLDPQRIHRAEMERARIQREIDALDKEVETLLTPYRQRRQALLDEQAWW